MNLKRLISLKEIAFDFDYCEQLTDIGIHFMIKALKKLFSAKLSLGIFDSKKEELLSSDLQAYTSKYPYPGSSLPAYT